jgi:hypothetical protein
MLMSFLKDKFVYKYNFQDNNSYCNIEFYTNERGFIFFQFYISTLSETIFVVSHTLGTGWCRFYDFYKLIAPSLMSVCLRYACAPLFLSINTSIDCFLRHLCATENTREIMSVTLFMSRISLNFTLEAYDISSDNVG